MTIETKLRSTAGRPARVATLFLLALAFICHPARTSAQQWTTSGNNINNTNPGNVGVGTTNPQYGRLQVNKSVRIDDDSGSASGSDVFGSGPNLYIGTSGGGAAFQFNLGGGLDLWQYNSPAWARTFTFSRNGNLGIGTSNPLASLQIGGYTTFNNPSAPGHSQFINNAHFSGTWKYINNDVASLLQMKDGLVYANAPAGTTGSALTWNERMRIDGAGNMGIGTNAPAHKLDVAGNVNAQAFCLNGDCRTAWSQIGGTPGGTSQWTTSGANLFYNGGHVGIGNSAPGSLLFVGSGAPAFATLPGLNVALGGNSYVAASNGLVNTFIGADTSPYGIVGTLTNHPLGLRANNTLAMTIMPSGDVGIGTQTPAAKLDVAGNINVSGNINAKYQDIAEWVVSSQRLGAGSVVVLDPERPNQVLASTQSYDTRVAGVVSFQPGITLGESGAGKVQVATTGRVKVKVDATCAPVKIGDLLVTGDKAGTAMKSVAAVIGGVSFHRPGTIIGKALEPLANGTGEILVLLSLQ